MADIREKLTLEDSFSANFTRYITLGQQAAGVTDDMRASLLNIETATAAAATATERMADQLTEMGSQTQKTTAGTSALLGSLKSLVATYASMQGVKMMVGLSDTMSQTTARLDMMNDGLQTTAELENMIFESAQRSRGLYTDTAAFVSKLGTLAGDAFDSSAEIVAFAEQINKQMVLSGTTTQEAQAAMLQLTQGLSSGVLRGEELNSVLEQTPMIAQTIADYMGVTTGEMRNLASEGKVTAEVVKNAMFAAAEETNAKFAEMPMTWAQVFTQAQNILIQTFQPLLDGIGQLAQFAGQNLDIIIPLFYGLAAAVAFYAAAQWIATGAAKAFFAALTGNPILLAIAIAIGVVVYALYQWIQSMGGLQVAWLVVVDAVLYAWDTLKAGFFTGVYFVMNLFDQMGLKIQTVATSIQNFMGDMKVGVLTILQNMVNNAVDTINWFIDKLNLIPGVAIAPIQQATFAATAAAENEVAKQQRNAALEAARAEVESRIASRADELASMWEQRDTNHAARQAEIAQKQAEQAAGGDSAFDQSFDQSAESYAGTESVLNDISDSVSSIEKSVSMSDEDLKSLIDMAERRYVSNVNLTSQTPVINISGANTGNTASDRKALADAIQAILMEQIASTSVRATALPT